MQVFIKEALHVLDYQNNIVDTIFLSDDTMTQGYAYNITVEDSNTGYSNLTFTMPTKVLRDSRKIGDTKDSAQLIDNPKLKLLTPLVKLRYRRQVLYTGEETIRVQEPVGYGDALVFTEKIYTPEYPNNVIEDYVMDYIVQPTEHKRSGLEVSITYTAIDYPRFNLSKKKMGATINDETVTKGIWSLYKPEPMSIPGSVQFIRWTEEMSEQYGKGAKVPTSWSPATATDYPLNSDQIYSMMETSKDWPYGLTATVFWWPITSTGRFEGVIYNEGDYLILNVYPKFETGEVDVSEITYSLDFYGYTWNYLEKGDSYLTPNNPCNYLNWILETTNWTVALNNSKKYVGTYFNKEDFPTIGSSDQYLLYQVIKKDSAFRGHFSSVEDLTELTGDDVGSWAVISNEDGTYQYRWDGSTWYKEENGISKIDTYIYTGCNTNAIVWNGVPEPDTAMGFGDGLYLCKISNDFYRGDDFLGASITLTHSNGEDVGTYEITEENILYMDDPTTDTVIVIDNQLIGLLSFKSGDADFDGTYLALLVNEENPEEAVWVSSIVFANNEASGKDAWIDSTEEIWTGSIDKSTGVLYDVDQVETEIAKPNQSVGDLFETVALQCSLSAGDSNCYNIITEIAKQFQLYPVFDCIHRTVALKLFAGKNYGLTYRLGLSLENTGVKKDGDKVITKLRCFGGQDNQGNENINLGEAERSFRLYNAGVYKSWASLPEETDAVWAVVGDMPTENYWEFDPEQGTRNVYKYDATDGLWVKVQPTTDEDGTIHNYVETTDGVFDIDLETGMPLPWDPNDPAYIQSRSPYGTEYVYNFKWMYDNDWMTKGQILGIYEYNNKIQKLNKKFLEPYTKDFLKTNDAYVNAGVVYSTMQDEYLACLKAMMNSYYRHPGKTTEKFSAFPEPPADCRPGNPNTPGENANGYYLDINVCPNCHYTSNTTFTTCPKCGEENTAESFTIHVNTWIEEQSSPESTTSEKWKPSSKGYYQKIYDTFAGEEHKFYLTKPFRTEAIDDLTTVPSTMSNETMFFLERKDGEEDSAFYDKSAGLYNWNDYVEKWTRYHALAEKARKDVELYQDRVEMLEQEFKNYQYDLENLEDTIQDNWGDYIIEGKFSDSQIVYPAVLLAKSLEASDKYATPEITYTLNVVDSSGLIEYRNPHTDTYNELIRTLHNKGQIIPCAGDYVGIYDEQLGLYNTPGLITTIRRVLDNPQTNSITLDTAYTDADDLVGNIITATNTVLNNTDIYARTAVLKADGSIDGASLAKTFEQNSNENLSFVGVKGSTLLDSTGLLVSNPSDPNRKMKYTGSGIYGTVDNGASYDLMMGPSGINANYINAGLIDTQSVQIISGQRAKVKLDNLGLSVVDNSAKAYFLPQAADDGGFRDWSNSNLKAFIGVDKDNEALLYLSGQMVVEKGSKIAGWNVLEDKLYSGSGSSYVGLGTSGDYRIWAGNSDPAKASFSVKADGSMYSTSGTIGDWKIGANTISQTHTASDGKKYAVTLSNYNNDNADSRVLHCSTDGTDTFYILRNGKLYAENADIKGKITATSGSFTGTVNASGGSFTGSITASGGTIGGWTISGKNIKYGSVTTLNGSTGQVSTSYLSATGGSIGGWEIKSDGFYGTNSHIKPSGSAQFTCSGGAVVKWNDGIRLHGPSGVAIGTNVNSQTLTAGETIIGMGSVKVKGNGYGITLDATTGGAPLVNGRVYLKASVANSAGNSVSDSSIALYTDSGSIRMDAYTNVKITTRGSSGIVLLQENGGKAYYKNSNTNSEIATIGLSSSTLNVKTNVVKKDTSDILDILNQIDIYDYKYIPDFYDGKEDYGYIIDYLEQIPGIDKYLTFVPEKIGNINTKRVNHEQFDKFLLSAIVSLAKQIKKEKTN